MENMKNMKKGIYIAFLCIVTFNTNAEYTAKVYLDNINFKGENNSTPPTGSPNLIVSEMSTGPFYYSSPNIYRVQNTDNSGEPFNIVRLSATMINQADGQELYSYMSQEMYNPNFTSDVDLHAFYGPDIEFPAEGYIDVNIVFKVIYFDNSWNEITSRNKTDTKSYRLIAPNWTPPSEVNLTMNINAETLFGHNGTDLYYGYTEDTSVYNQVYGSGTGNNFTYRSKDFKLNTIIFVDNRGTGYDCSFLGAIRSNSGRDAAMLYSDTDYNNVSFIQIGPYTHNFISTMNSRPNNDASTQYYVDLGNGYSGSSNICNMLDYLKANPTTNINITLNAD
jgi:hypothetical protein